MSTTKSTIPEGALRAAQIIIDACNDRGRTFDNGYSIDEAAGIIAEQSGLREALAALKLINGIRCSNATDGTRCAAYDAVEAAIAKIEGAK